MYSCFRQVATSMSQTAALRLHAPLEASYTLRRLISGINGTYESIY